VVPQVTSCEQVHDQVQVLTVLESIVHVYQEGTVEEGEDLPLIHDRLNTSLGEDSGLVHFLHGVYFAVLLVLYFPYFTETTFSNAVVVVE
jgi:hypothetical protein